MKKITSIILLLAGSVVLATLLIFGFYLFGSNDKPDVHDGAQDIMIGADLVSIDSGDEALLGSHHNVFVAKVIKQVGVNEDRGAPHTQFEVEIVYNIKGNAQGVATVDQNGAYVGGVLRVVRVDNPAIKQEVEGYLLQPGYTYILATRHFEGSGSYYLSLHSMAKTLVSRDSNLSNEQLEELARGSERVYELLAAYINEKLLSVDTYNGTAFNNFQSLSNEQKEAIYDKFEKLIPPRLVPEIVPREPIDFSEPSIENRRVYCADGIDNDNDGLIDFNDPECKEFYRENILNFCRDRADNDRDSLIDGSDPDCSAFVKSENSQESCSDGLDNDLDGYKDSRDPDCVAFYPPPPYVPPPTPTSTAPAAPTHTTSTQ